jgi:hypothetical protein
MPEQLVLIEADSIASESCLFALFSCLSVRSSFSTSGAARHRIPLLAAYTATRRTGILQATCVHPSVRPVAVDPAKSNRLDRTPISAVCNFYTIAKRIHVPHNAVYNTRAQLISSTYQGPSSLQLALPSPCCKSINWQLAHVYASLH